MDLEFTINEQTCRLDDKRQQAVNLSENYLVLSFTFTEDWEDTGKFVLYPMEDGTVLRQGINNDKTVVPADVLTGDKFYFTVYGVNNNERITTNLVKVNLLKSGYTDDAITPGEDELTPSVVEEIYLALDSKVANTTFEPEINSVNQDIETIYNTFNTKSDLGHKHKVADITDFPSNVSYFTNDTGYLVSEDIENKVDKETGKGLTTNDFTNQYKSLIDNSQSLRIASVDQTSTRDQFTATIPNLTVNHSTIVGLLNSKGYNNDNATLNVNNVEKPIYVGNAPIRMYEWAFGRIGLFVYVTWTSINSGNGAWVLLNPYNSGG